MKNNPENMFFNLAMFAAIIKTINIVWLGIKYESWLLGLSSIIFILWANIVFSTLAKLIFGADKGIAEWILIVVNLLGFNPILFSVLWYMSKGRILIILSSIWV